jgi:hypothetical protein
MKLLLESSGVGCYMAGVYSGATDYADDVKLLTPCVKALKTLVIICQNYAKKYDVILFFLHFNSCLFLVCWYPV